MSDIALIVLLAFAADVSFRPNAFGRARGKWL